MDTQIKKIQRDRRRKRIRAKIFGVGKKPRLSVFKSNKYISAQLIDDSKGATLASATSKNIKGKNSFERAKAVGISIAEQAKAKNISVVVFDRGGYIYTGSVSALADGAREAGLKF
ncbi:MAG: 50S ribosomal protein L18 [Candidatus Zambryskibacteria bacterium RIFCSPHIGHO2_12_FULL_38_34]|uniref:Large ribosomal subunit protein uL18 n=1 Tax=Candidatus Zambryskibacteria bacterium RIFCSPLOWO2_12_FULL_39_16 TaxID=1802775 RepID=A0A1G2URQ7_9BACT|nr:MAG: 50S ribosomal protein L18 [Candidatus Zambryskibacteria bacterium RIFCSPHIGHO2_02_FULL_38_22]OHA98396.1 MAG: 50S ribosomal protein L18 [Candidatus Zambryskibacteria bacterium RIFCSPHIGHO2_12_FULL_38_34]OHB12077.1 MAG: 50S ribosomal protein L18 [Candidatus Zambryskibacteria bacterium RIFCSPLOWO2_12_FULL_39_16]